MGALTDLWGTQLDMLDDWEERGSRAVSGSEARGRAEAVQQMSGLSPVQYQGEARLGWIDKRGIDVQILLPTLGYMPYRAAMRAGLRELGCMNGAICLFETRMDSSAIVLTSNSES